MTTPAPTFLFSIDLEDVRTMVPGGDRYAPRIPQMTERYLEFLRSHKARATFFIVGRTARDYPGLIRAIAAEGHELACHTDTHTPLSALTPATLRDDIARNLEALAPAAANPIRGFRAPILSLTQQTTWAYEILESLGFTYSSSVLPAKNPLHGWPGFGETPRRFGAITEIPVTIAHLPPRVPFASGVYFRVLPWPLIRASFRSALASNRPVVGYFHPYDIDTQQERFMHPGINSSRFYNFLMYHGRGRTLPRLERVMAMGWRICTYQDHLAAPLGAAA